MRVIVFLLIVATVLGCTVDSDCRQNYVCEESDCKHKHLFPLEGMEILGTILIFACSALSNASGQGGGPLMTLILLILFNYDPSVALPMVQLVLLGGTSTGFFLRIPMRHPTRDRPLIDYNALVLLSPPLLIGISLGVILGLIFPSWLILALLTVVLIYITFTSAQMSVKIYKKENTERKKVAAEKLVAEEEEDRPTIVDETSNEVSDDLREILKTEKRWFPPIPLTIFLVLFLFAVLCSFIKGSSNHPSIIGITQCTPAYWIMLLLIFSGFGVFSIFVIWYIVHNTRKKMVLGYNFDSYDIVWSFKPILTCLICGLLAGVGSSLLSFGGSIILGPMMLKLGFRPEVSAGTSTIICVLTASISIIQYAIAGKLELIYGIWVYCFSLIGSLTGICFIKAIVNKYKRASIMVIMLTILMGICSILIPAYGIVQLAGRDDLEYGFRPYCH